MSRLCFLIGFIFLMGINQQFPSDTVFFLVDDASFIILCYMVHFLSMVC